MSKIRELIDELRLNKCSIKLNDVNNINLIFEDKTELSPELIEKVRKNKLELIDYLKLSLQKVELRIEKSAIQTSYPISDAQRRLWVLSQFEEGKAAYNIPASVYLDEDIHIDCFKSAIDAVIARHEILRTVFREDETGVIRQWILSKEELCFTIDYKDLRNEASKDEKVKDYIASDSYSVFDLQKGPLLRAGLLQVADAGYVFYYNMHHIISDGWSMEVLKKDVLSYYNAYRSGKQGEAMVTGLKALRIQYKDYSAWQLAQLESEVFKGHRSYWLNSLKGEVPLLDLPGSKQRPAIKTNNGHGLITCIDRNRTEKLKNYSEVNGGSLFMGLLAVWNILLYRYTSQSDIIIGTPIAGREHADLEDQIGFYVNTLALRNAVDPEENFQTFYAALKEKILTSYRHQMYPFDRLVEELNLLRDTSRSAVFDVMFIFQNTGDKIQHGAAVGGGFDEILDLGMSASKFDMEIAVQEVGDYLSLQVVYNTDVYEGELIEGLLIHYKQLLDVLLENPEEKIGQVDYLSQSEKQQLAEDFQGSKVAYPASETVVTLFEEQVKNTPDKIALVVEERMLSYRQVDELANQLGAYLQKQYDIQANDLIGIKQEKSEWLIISILGVLKSGGAYVPIDPDYPEERIAYIEADTTCKVCIDEAELLKFHSTQSLYCKSELGIHSQPGDLAYVIYTSGSTGSPKGVMIEHKNLVHSTVARMEVYKEAQCLLFLSSISFDSSVAGIFGTLLHGGQLVLTSTADSLHVDKIVELIERKKISQLILVSTFYKLLLNKLCDRPNGLKVVSVGGEECSEELVALHQQSPALQHCDLYNEYGPTECTVWSSYYKYEKGSDFIATIGRPVFNTGIYIVNEWNKLQPIGVTGEICIGGGGLARGYLNQEGLTREKFIENPLKAGDRLYKTGDLGRWRKDGCIEFMGRKDDQVKIRGYRIELGEIEQSLLKNSALKEAVVLVRENANKEKELIAYISSATAQTSAALRSSLKAFLPDYMLPAYYVQLEELPRNNSGKIDKRALPDPEGLGLTSGVVYIAPRTEQEKVLASVWADVLKREGISIKDSFYNLGGDSIKSIQVVSRLKQKGYTLKVEYLLRTPVLEELSLLVQQTTKIIDQSEINGSVELTPIQKWFFEDPVIKVHNHLNQSVLLESKEVLDTELLEKSLADLTRHHDALRMVYKKANDGWEQINQDTTSTSFTLDFYDLRETDHANMQMFTIGEQLQCSINIEEGPLVRIVHFRLKDGDRLGLIIHHLVVDGVSWRILLEDLSTLYTSYKKGKKTALPLKTDAFQKWALLQKEYAKSEKLQKERAYWEAQCNQELESLPQDQKVKEDEAILDVSESFSLDKQVTALLQTSVHSVYRTEINDVLLTGLALTIKEVWSREKSVLKMEGHGREEIIEGADISRTVGWFTSMYPFVLDVSNSASNIKALINVKEALRRVPNKGIGYGILKYLAKEGIESQIIPEIVFNYLGDFGRNAGGSKEHSLFEYASESIGSSSAQANGNDALLDISGILVMGELRMSIRYSKLRYHSQTIKKLIKSYEKNVRAILNELSGKQESYLTPSDLTFRGLTAEELSVINSDNNVEDIYELSPLQEGIYYHWLSEESSSLYFEQMSYRVRGKKLDIKNLKRAYDGLISRHGILRTGFSNDYAGRSLQIVRKTVPSNFTCEQIEEELTEEAKQNHVQEIKLKDRAKGFDLSGPSQMRLHIIDLSEGVYEFIWSNHHILMDGWCMSILINDFNELLSTETRGDRLKHDLVIPYSNYINWLNKIDKENSLGYWKNYLSGYSQVAQIPFKIKTEERAYGESRKHLQIDGALFNKVDALCNQLGITHNIFIQGVWGYLLSRYNNTNDVVFGAVVSGRPAELQGVEDMVGLFINTIPVRVTHQPGDTPIDLLKPLQEKSIQSTAHHYLNLSEVQAQSELGMNLINHILVFENYAVKEFTGEGVLNTQKEEGIFIESMEAYEQANYDFSISVGPSSTSLNINVIYNTYRYDSSSLKRLTDHFNNLIIAFAERADQPLHTFSYVSETEKQALLITFNDTKADYPRDKTIVDVFEKQVTKTPDRIALVFEDRQLTYRELNERSNQLAHYLLKQYQIKPDHLIGIRLDRSEWMIISILGILKSGGAYVPIDPEHPQERIDYILNDSGCKVVIDTQELTYFKKEEKQHSRENPLTINKPDDLAYIIYTSGSTGKPKGVMVEHGSVINLIHSQTNTFHITAEEKILQFSNYGFDASVEQILLALHNGASLVLISKELLLRTDRLEAFIQEQKITHLNATPGFLETIEPANCRILKRVVAGGEACKKELQERYAGIADFYNAYGPTETTVTSIMYYHGINQAACLDILPIGKPISNNQVYILSEEKQLQPKEIPGEIYIGGAGLTRGYLNQEVLTKEKFIVNPFRKGEWLYKTGDLGKWTTDGNIMFIGRKDEQVKIRGYRIELGEIEHALLKNKQVEAVLVIAKENQNKEKELIAYIIAKTEQNTNELRSFLKNSLPDYMLPSYYIQLEVFPLTVNGKIDKKLLPDPQGLGLGSGTVYTAPGNVMEKELLTIWKKVLQRTDFGVTDDFFELGGHSLKIIQAIREYASTVGKKIPINFFISNPTIAEHGHYITSTLNKSIEDHEELIRLNVFSENNKNMILLPPVQGESIYFMGFSKFIEDRYNCYGISYGIDHDFKSLTALSSYYAEVINKQFSGQKSLLSIMGFSMGVPIAFEIVKTLEAVGYNCELLLIDRIPNSTSYVKEMKKMNFNNDERWIDHQVSIAAKIFPEESLVRIRKGIRHNNELLNNYRTTGKIKSAITCIEGAAEASVKQVFDMRSWEKYTHGEFRSTKIESAHDEIFNKENYEKLCDALQMQVID